LEGQISAHKRVVDELRKENERSRDAARDLEVKIAALRDSAKTEQRAADKTADQIRAERDTLQARLARLEQVSSPRRALSVVVAMLKLFPRSRRRRMRWMWR
jgi:predicted  nucleic acid-binding Zn-ribbon protein